MSDDSSQVLRRRATLTLVVFGHAAALVLGALGWWWWALIVLLPAGFLLVWGSLWPHSRLFGPVVCRLRTTQRQVWLSFDDGPDADTAELLEVLDRHRARATFFLVGVCAAQQPSAVRAIVERGHAIGNHSQTHPSGRFWMLSGRGFDREITDAQATLTTLAGQPPRWFRAVAGLTNPLLDPVLRRHGLRRVSWSGRGFDSVDGDDTRVLRRLLRSVRPGAILMLHQGLAPGRVPRLTDALLTELATRGYTTVLPGPDAIGVATTSQLLNGVRPHSGENVADKPSDASSDVSRSRVG